MPKDFTKCVKQGGKVRTIKPNKSTHMPVCVDKKGKSHAGYAKKTGRSR